MKSMSVFQVIRRLVKAFHNKKASGQSRQKQSLPVSRKLAHNKDQIRRIMGDSQDIIMRDLYIALDNGGRIRAMLLAIDGMVDEIAIREHVLKSLIAKPLHHATGLIPQVKERLFLKSLQSETDLMRGIGKVIKGSALLFFDGQSEALLLHTEGFEVRPIMEPPSEVIVKGPREGFVESLATNTTLLRRRIQHPALRFEAMVIGEFTRSNVTIAYIQGIVDPRIVQQVKARLRSIQTDNLMSSGELEQYVEDATYSIFPTVGNTERPDKAAAMMLEGRVIILVDGDPSVLIVPYLFIQSLQSQEDYSSRPYYSSFLRILRLFAFIGSFALPSIYILAVNFHKEMIPSELIVSMAEARQRVPFPLEMELLALMIAFEIVREAGVRMPRAIGQAVSIVGALILGQVSVQAGFIGAPTIIVVALSVVSSFIITPIAEVTAILRFLCIIPTSLFGFYGFLGFMLVLLTHMVSLTSIGVSYLAPISPFYGKDWKDTFVRLPYRWFRNRPQSIPHLRPVRIQRLPNDRKDGR